MTLTEGHCLLLQLNCFSKFLYDLPTDFYLFFFSWIYEQYGMSLSGEQHEFSPVHFSILTIFYFFRSHSFSVRFSFMLSVRSFDGYILYTSIPYYTPFYMPANIFQYENIKRQWNWKCFHLLVCMGKLYPFMLLYE